MSLGTVSYHLNQVLANECEIVEIVDTVPRRGAVEKFYKLKRGTLMDGVSLDLGEGAEVEGPLGALSLEECLLAAVEAVDASGGGSDRDVWEWFAVELDGEGWQEIRAAQADFNSRIRQAVEGGQSRAVSKGARAAVVGTAALSAFPSGADD